jgi:hypothetical protein
MKSRLSAFVFCLLLGSAGHALAATLPDSCGDDKITYQVKTEKGKTVPPVPAEGKAEIIFIERENQMVTPFHYATVRLGMDGAWVGANYDNSYFAVSVAPGTHHLCANWQSTLQKVKNTTDVTSFTAQPGKVYYLAAQLTVSGGGEGGPTTTFSLSQVNEDKGNWWLKTSKHSISKQH